MTEGDDRRSWTLNRRLEFIDWKLFWEGRLNRNDLEEMFGISQPQASVDLRNYRDAAPENIEYNSTEKAYLPGRNMRPSFLRISADRILLQLRAFLTGALPREDLWFRDLPTVDMAPDIARHVDPDLLRRVLAAIRSRHAVDIRYQSLTKSRWRAVAPHALAFDGYRWHLRAWCCEREDFRDFVLSRIDEWGQLKPAFYDPADDMEWNTKITLRLCPHSGLNEEQKQAILRDYDMSEGCREIEVRLSMAYYFIKRMNLDLSDLPPARAQIELQNLADVQAAIRQAKIDSQELVQARKGRSQ
ncbi:helix-turn-helix transcriptional regulator [Brevundimonas diminuta]|uniref:helix-turn-helix transcriptional regulator n=1 Tax=Brevundimonas diminuta TaxID=293 RepID=UPI0030FA27A0